MSAVSSNHGLRPEIGCITIFGTQMTTWRDNNQAILRLVKVAPVKPGIMTYILQECNQSTIKDAAQFENLLDKNLIYIYTKEGELISFPNKEIGEEIEKKNHVYALAKGDKSSILTPSVVLRMTNSNNVTDAKTHLKKISKVFDKGIVAS